VWIGNHLNFYGDIVLSASDILDGQTTHACSSGINHQCAALGSQVQSKNTVSCQSGAVGRYLCISKTDNPLVAEDGGMWLIETKVHVSSCRCEAASYATNRSTRCKQCPLNSSTPAAGSTDISQCACNPGFSGTYHECIACTPGTFKTGYGSAACTGCAAGKASDAAAPRCTECAADSYTAHDNSRCDVCPSNSTSPAGSVNVTACICVPGFTRKNVECTGCMPGKFKGNAGSEECTDCGLGAISYGSAAS